MSRESAPQALGATTNRAPSSLLSGGDWRALLLEACAPFPPQAPLARRVASSPADPSAWWALLSSLESVPLSSPFPPVSLQRLYERAARETRRPPRSALRPPAADDPRRAFLSIWLGYARRQWLLRDASEGRDVYKVLRTQDAGCGDARLHAEWACLEATGPGGEGVEAARAIASKAAKDRAGPPELVQRLLQAVEGRGPFPVERWREDGVPGSASRGSALARREDGVSGSTSRGSALARREDGVPGSTSRGSALARREDGVPGSTSRGSALARREADAGRERPSAGANRGPTHGATGDGANEASGDPCRTHAPPHGGPRAAPEGRSAAGPSTHPLPSAILDGADREAAMRARARADLWDAEVRMARAADAERHARACAHPSDAATEATARRLGGETGTTRLDVADGACGAAHAVDPPTATMTDAEHFASAGSGQLTCTAPLPTPTVAGRDRACVGVTPTATVAGRDRACVGVTPTATVAGRDRAVGGATPTATVGLSAGFASAAKGAWSGGEEAARRAAHSEPNLTPAAAAPAPDRPTPASGATLSARRLPSLALSAWTNIGAAVPSTEKGGGVQGSELGGKGGGLRVRRLGGLGRALRVTPATESAAAGPAQEKRVDVLRGAAESATGCVENAVRPLVSPRDLVAASSDAGAPRSAAPSDAGAPRSAAPSDAGARRSAAPSDAGARRSAAPRVPSSAPPEAEDFSFRRLPATSARTSQAQVLPTSETHLVAPTRAPAGAEPQDDRAAIGSASVPQAETPPPPPPTLSPPPGASPPVIAGVVADDGAAGPPAAAGAASPPAGAPVDLAGPTRPPDAADTRKRRAPDLPTVSPGPRVGRRVDAACQAPPQRALRGDTPERSRDGGGGGAGEGGVGVARSAGRAEVEGFGVGSDAGPEDALGLSGAGKSGFSALLGSSAVDVAAPADEAAASAPRAASKASSSTSSVSSPSSSSSSPPSPPASRLSASRLDSDRPLPPLPPPPSSATRPEDRAVVSTPRPPSAASAVPSPPSDSSDDSSSEETAPVVMSRLASRVAHGRHSLAPSRVGRGRGEEDDENEEGGARDAPAAGAAKVAAPARPEGLPRPTRGTASSAPASPGVAPLACSGDRRADEAIGGASGRPTPQRSQARGEGRESAGEEAASRLERQSERPERREQRDREPQQQGHQQQSTIQPSTQQQRSTVQQQGNQHQSAPASHHHQPHGFAPHAAQQPSVSHAALPQPPLAIPAPVPSRRVIEDERTVTVRRVTYQKLECVGRGGSSRVYKVLAPNRRIFALKRIRLSGRDPEAASGFLDEIRLLSRLRGAPNIITLVDSEVHRAQGMIYMVLEYGDVDLAKLLAKHEAARRAWEEAFRAGEARERQRRREREQRHRAAGGGRGDGEGDACSRAAAAATDASPSPDPPTATGTQTLAHRGPAQQQGHGASGPGASGAGASASSPTGQGTEHHSWPSGDVESAARAAAAALAGLERGPQGRADGGGVAAGGGDGGAAPGSAVPDSSVASSTAAPGSSSTSPAVASSPTLRSRVDVNFVRLQWEQMLRAVSVIHAARIVHSDLKPANFLVVEGELKLIDFGIAKAIGADTTSIARESQVGTLNYMSPESILGGRVGPGGGSPMRVGRPSDVWSLGCILYQMAHGKTPFAHLPFIQKMHAITDPVYEIEHPPLGLPALEHAIKRCLVRDPTKRATIPELLAHPFLRPPEDAGSGRDGGGEAVSAPLGAPAVVPMGMPMPDGDGPSPARLDGASSAPDAPSPALSASPRSGTTAASVSPKPLVSLSERGLAELLAAFEHRALLGATETFRAGGSAVPGPPFGLSRFASQGGDLSETIARGLFQTLQTQGWKAAIEGLRCGDGGSADGGCGGSNGSPVAPSAHPSRPRGQLVLDSRGNATFEEGGGDAASRRRRAAAASAGRPGDCDDETASTEADLPTIRVGAAQRGRDETTESVDVRRIERGIAGVALRSPSRGLGAPAPLAASSGNGRGNVAQSGKGGARTADRAADLPCLPRAAPASAADENADPGRW